MKKINSSFYFVRHCQTNWNEKKLCQGITDIPLSEKGVADSQDLAIKLQDISIDIIYVSNLTRAMETASHIADKLDNNVELKKASDLKERAFGRLEGLHSELMYTFEKLESEGELSDSAYNNLEIESLVTFSERISKSFHQIENAKERNVLVVSHGRVFNMLCKLLKVDVIQQLKHNEIIYFYKINNEWAWKKV